MKHKQTKKLFYGKWPYKVSYSIPGISVMRERDFTQIREYVKNPPDRMLRWRGSFIHDVTANKDNITSVIDFLETLPKERYQTRIETSNLDIYTDTDEVFSQAMLILPEKISSAYAPAPGTSDLLSNKKNILVKKFPENKFQHKVFLHPHKSSDITNKALIVKWIKSQDHLHITDSTAQWFITTNWNWDRRYIMAQNEQSLLMLKLRCGDLVGPVYDYKLVDK